MRLGDGTVLYNKTGSDLRAEDFARPIVIENGGEQNMMVDG